MNIGSVNSNPGMAAVAQSAEAMKDILQMATDKSHDLGNKLVGMAAGAKSAGRARVVLARDNKLRPDGKSLDPDRMAGLLDRAMSAYFDTDDPLEPVVAYLISVQVHDRWITRRLRPLLSDGGFHVGNGVELVVERHAGEPVWLQKARARHVWDERVGIVLQHPIARVEDPAPLGDAVAVEVDQQKQFVTHDPVHGSVDRIDRLLVAGAVAR